MSPRAVAILLAAGRGERLGASTPKALVRIDGRPLVAWAVEAVERVPDIEAFWLTVASGSADAIAEAARSPKLAGVVTGGVERQDSVAAALAAIPPGPDRVVCHDVARPFARPELFASVLAAIAGEGGSMGADGAVPVVAAADTLKRLRDGVVEGTLDRSEVAIAQTPQAFRRDALVEGHRLAGERGLRATDDAALLEAAGFRVVAVPGDPENFKVTVPADLRRAEAMAASRA